MKSASFSSARQLTNAVGAIVIAGVLTSHGSSALNSAHYPGQATFHFYGAEDCPPCMAFKRDGLPIVQELAARLGFAVAVNIIPRTRHVPHAGVFGDADALLRLAEAQLDPVYPPIFFISLRGSPETVHGPDWRGALEAIERIAALSMQNSAQPDPHR